jgi:hypothetical protein
MEDNFNESDLYEDIYKYLEDIDDSRTVTSDGFDELIHVITAKTGVTPQTAQMIFVSYYKEVVNALLRQDTICNKGGAMWLSPQRTTMTPIFHVNLQIRKKLNDG